MAKKFMISSLLVVLVSLLFATTALAAKTKYTFADVTIDETIVEIEASVKENKNNQYSSCSYFSDDYETYLGKYEDSVIAGSSDEDVKTFCVDNFSNRSE